MFFDSDNEKVPPATLISQTITVAGSIFDNIGPVNPYEVYI
jgi:hypothetical protein